MSVTDTYAKSTLVTDFSMVLEKSFNPYGDKSLRVPFYITSSYREANGASGVSMQMNPSTVHFSQPKRITRRDTQGGSVFYHWTNRDGRNNDILKMDFSGQTGNIGVNFGTVNGSGAQFFGSIWNHTIGGIANDGGRKVRNPIDWVNKVAANNRNVEDTNLGVVLSGDNYNVSGASRLSNFLNLYSITREPANDPQTGQPIQYFVSYSSPLFANTFVTFIGHFNNVLDFTEDANDPFNLKYTFSFTVLASMPSMDSIYTTVSQNLSNTFMNPLG